MMENIKAWLAEAATVRFLTEGDTTILQVGSLWVAILVLLIFRLVR